MIARCPIKYAWLYGKTIKYSCNFASMMWWLNILVIYYAIFNLMLFTEILVLVGMPVGSCCYSGFRCLVCSIFVDLRGMPIESHFMCYYSCLLISISQFPWWNVTRDIWWIWKSVVTPGRKESVQPRRHTTKYMNLRQVLFIHAEGLLKEPKQKTLTLSANPGNRSPLLDPCLLMAFLALDNRWFKCQSLAYNLDMHGLLLKRAYRMWPWYL
jgi:hypothetical protein